MSIAKVIVMAEKQCRKGQGREDKVSCVAQPCLPRTRSRLFHFAAPVAPNRCLIASNNSPSSWIVGYSEPLKIQTTSMTHIGGTFYCDSRQRDPTSLSLLNATWCFGAAQQIVASSYLDSVQITLMLGSTSLSNVLHRKSRRQHPATRDPKQPPHPGYRSSDAHNDPKHRAVMLQITDCLRLVWRPSSVAYKHDNTKGLHMAAYPCDL